MGCKNLGKTSFRSMLNNSQLSNGNTIEYYTPPERNIDGDSSSEKNTKIGIISVWLGKFPNTFELWIKSVKFNPTIDFILITDQDYVSKIENLRVVKTTLEKIKELATKNLKMEIVLTKPYKLCDFKPVYGVIFKEYLEKYDYWGSCDLDLVFGDIRYFTDYYNLKTYDKFLNEGHLSLYRNTEKCNNYYKEPGSYYTYDEVFSNENNFVFDERNRINNIYRFNGYPIFEKTIYANINPALKRFQCCRLKNYRYQVFYWQNGAVYRTFIRNGKINNEEFCYIHLLKRKFPMPEREILESNAFYFTDRGYYLKKSTDCPSIEEIKKYSFNCGGLYEAKERMINYWRHNWSKPAFKRRVTSFMFKYKWGRKILHKNF